MTIPNIFCDVDKWQLKGDYRDAVIVRNWMVFCLSAFGILIGRSRHSKEIEGNASFAPSNRHSTVSIAFPKAAFATQPKATLDKASLWRNLM